MKGVRSLSRYQLFGAFLVAVYFLYYSVGSLRAEFTQDDLMNCYFAWRRPLGSHVADIILFFYPTPTYRPVGAFLYKVSFSLFGFSLLPMRLLLLVLLGANLVLLCSVASRLTELREVGLIAALLGAYHEYSAHLLYNTGTLYDICCFLFYFSALLYYVRARKEERPLRLSQVMVFSLLYVLALDSKEIAVSLPVMLGAYEVLFHWPARRHRGGFLRGVWRDGIAVWVSGGATAAFIAWRVSGPGSLSQLGAYKPVFSVAKYLNAAGHLVGQLLYVPRTVS